MKPKKEEMYNIFQNNLEIDIKIYKIIKYLFVVNYRIIGNKLY